MVVLVVIHIFFVSDVCYIDTQENFTPHKELIPWKSKGFVNVKYEYIFPICVLKAFRKCILCRKTKFIPTS